MSKISSIQRGTTLCASGNDPTYIGISAVNTAKATVEYLGSCPTGTGTYFKGRQGYLYLYSSTSLAFVPQYNGVGIYGQYISWEVVQFT